MITMSKKSYDSSVYYAQTFKEAYENFMKNEFGGGYIARHSNDTVSFSFAGVSSHVKFNPVKEKLQIILEMSSLDREEREDKFDELFEVKRSSGGRVSGDYYKKILEEFIIPKIREFYKEDK